MEAILQELRHDQIPWALERLDMPERVDLLTLAEFELLEHAGLLQREVGALRAIVRAAIDLLHQRDRELETARRETGRLRAELRAIRERMERDAA